MKKILLVLSIGILALTARGNSVVFNTLGPGGTYDLVGSSAVKGSATGLQEFAAQFTALATGNLATVDLGLTYFDPSTQGPVDVYLYGDAGGSPDNLSQILLGSGTPTAQVFTTNNSLVSFAVAGTVPVTIGTTYWLVLKPGSATVRDQWATSDPGVPGTFAFSHDDSSWTTVTTTGLYAFRLTASVPDSGSTLLLMFGSCLGLFCLQQFFLRRRAQSPR